MVQLIQRIAVRTPRFALLVGAKQIAGFVKCERVRDANSRGDSLDRFLAACELLNRAAFAVQFVMGDTVLDPVRIRIIGGDQAKVEIALWVASDANGIDAARSDIRRRPVGSYYCFRVG